MIEGDFNKGVGYKWSGEGIRKHRDHAVPQS